MSGKDKAGGQVKQTEAGNTVRQKEERKAEEKRQALPTLAQLEEELTRETYRKQYRRTLRSTIYILITVAAAAVLVATLLLPVLRIYGTSMTPTPAGRGYRGVHPGRRLRERRYHLLLV